MAHERFSHSCFCKCLSPGTFAGSRGRPCTGLPLYLSLGFVDNPYNIGWEDTVGIYAFGSSKAISGVCRKARDSKSTLRQWLTIVLEDPLLELRNIAAKAVLLSHYLALTGPTALSKIDVVTVTPRRLHLILTCFALRAIGFSPRGPPGATDRSSYSIFTSWGNFSGQFDKSAAD